MDLNLRGEGAVIIGAAQGIGLAIAQAFAREGAPVALVDRNPVVHNRAQEIAGEHGVLAIGAVADVTDYADMQQAATMIGAVIGAIRHVVYAAGMGSGKYGFPFWNLDPSDWPRVLNVNLLGAVHTAHAFTPPLVEARRGTLLF